MKLNARAATLGIIIFCPFLLLAQTTIINPANNTGTSGANGSFETAGNLAANGWTSVTNPTICNWYNGVSPTITPCTGSRAAYISSSTSGGPNSYNTTPFAGACHFYVNVTFPAGETCITLSFNWKGMGEPGLDGMKIYLGSTAVNPLGGTPFSTSDPSAVALGVGFYAMQASSCAKASITIPASFAGTTRRLVFSWEQNNSGGTNPPTIIDDISLVSQVTPVPGCATSLIPAAGATGVAHCGTTFSWTAPVPTGVGCDAATSYDVYFGTSPTPPLVSTTTSTNYTPASMAASTVYYWRVVPKNLGGSATCGTQSFTTGLPSTPEFGLIGDASCSPPYQCVSLTANAGGQRGCAWDATSTMNFLSNFSYEMEVNLGAFDSATDGMTFVIHNDPVGRCKCGTTASGRLAAGGITNSVIIEIDTYMDDQDKDDFVSPFIGCAGLEDPDHLDIWFNGIVNPDLDGSCNTATAGERAVPNAVRLQSSPGVNYNIENNTMHIFRIAWNAATTTLTATVLNSALTVTYGTISSTFNPLTVFGTTNPYFGFTAATSITGNKQSFCFPSVLLPVTLTHYEAGCVNKQAALRWETETERDNDFYTIEKSCDGTTFTPIGKVDAVGSSVTPTTYSFTDIDQCTGVNYYRLSQTDINGNVQPLGVRSVHSCAETSGVLVFPNPATDRLTVTWNGARIERMAVFNAVGQRIFDQDGDSNLNSSMAELNVSNFTPGIYYLTVYDLNSTETVKVVIE